MDIAPSHHPVIIGYDGSNIKQVIRRTGATIYFPNTTTSVNSPRSTLYITGAIPNVFHARQELMVGRCSIVLVQNEFMSFYIFAQGANAFSGIVLLILIKN